MAAPTFSPEPRAPLRIMWVAAIFLPIGIQLLPGSYGPDRIAGSPQILFSVVVAAMALGALGSGLVINRAKRTNEAELGYLGLFFFAVSVISLAHALTIPGVIFNENVGSYPATFWAVPLAIIAGLPSALGRSRSGRSVDGEWQQWVVTFQYSIVALGSLMLIFNDLLPTPEVGSFEAKIAAAVCLVGCALLAERHHDLARIARDRSPLLVALGYGLVGASMLMWIGAVPYSQSFWIAQFLAIFGVMVGALGAISVYRRTDHVRPLIEKIIAVDPRCALEIGMEPSVHAFITNLETTDPATAEHVIRTTDLAMTVGPKLGLSGTDLRDLGLTALLHDIGKLLIPEEILAKPGELDDREYEIVRRHTTYGAEIVGASPALASIGPAILGHHEHIDGSGYPNGLRGPQVPLLARIVSVCDAFDAISSTRHHRPDIDQEAAIEILERYAGSKWDRRVVEVVVRTVRNTPIRQLPQRAEVTGRLGCDCVPQAKTA